MGLKLLICIIVGLGALYLLHKLAQDYMKIKKPASKLAGLLLSKRDLNAVILTSTSTTAATVDQFVIDWKRILDNDPLSCAQLLICQIVAGAEKHNDDAIIINTLMEYAMSIGVPKEIETAHRFGKKYNKSNELCYKQYPYCPYSARTMLKILQLYSYIFGD